jgi:hypothetical protein
VADHPRNPTDPSGTGVPEDILALILRYHDNDLDAAGLAQLRAALTQSDQARELFVRWSMHSQLLAESLSADYQEEADDPWQDSPNVLAELTKLEQQAQASLIEMHHIKQPWHKRPWIAGVAALAAMIVIAVVLTFVFTGPTGSPQITEDTSEPGRDTPAINHHVATLTAEHNATWAERALARGSQLTAGQTLTLTAGFAEISTARGAIAILEAPATIELIDNSNALELHSGKLVGICETESSKGFLVRTPHMDITDLGTRFGVNAQPDHVETTVFVGEVIASTPDGQTRRLTDRQTARLTLDDHATNTILIVESQVTQGYRQQMPRADLITDASINLDGFEVRVAPQGMQEGAQGYTDREYEFNGIDKTGIPTVLLGGDLVMMPADARSELNPDAASPLRLEIEVSEPADVYLLIDSRYEVEPWITRDYEKTEFVVGLDIDGDHVDDNTPAADAGPGIDWSVSVWKRKQTLTGRAVVGAEIEKTMYTIVATPVDDPHREPNN